MIFAYLCTMFRHIIKHKASFLSVLSAVFLTGLFGCASTGSPGGGLYDEDPPVLVKSVPSERMTGVKTQKITLRFNENIKLDKALEKLTVSPPQVKQPTIKSNAKTVTIELQDSLIPNSTYSIDLGDAVQDNNEGNPLEGLSLLFSTGDHIDSLAVSGYLLNAENLEPVTGAYVGIYNDTTALGDSVFLKRCMERACRTDAYGHFNILGIAPGTYRIYALTDGNTNYIYDLKTEDIAFLDSLVVPSTQGTVVYDTIWADLDSTIVDTITSRGEILYLPNDLLLRSFNEGKVTRYLDDNSRPDSVHLNIRFAANMPELPTISVVDSLESPIELIAEPNPTKDTLIYWIKDTIHIKMDTLNLQMSYLYTDTSGLDIIRTDTLRFTKPVAKKVAKKEDDSNKKNILGKKKGSDKKKDSGNKDATKKKRKKKGEAEPVDSLPKIAFVEVKLSSGKDLDIGHKPKIEVTTPLDSIDLQGIHLEVQKDSLWKEMKFSLVKDTAHLRRYYVVADPHYKPGESYQIRIDSAAIHDIYGNPVNNTKLQFKEKKPEDYSHLLFNINGTEGPCIVELLNDKDAAAYRVALKDGMAKFVNVKEGKYFVRLIEDRNNNGKWDTGNFEKREQPENVFYFGTELQLRANWDMSQTWNVRGTALHRQKPEAIKKNKPKEKEEKKSKNAEYLAKLGKTPNQTNTGTTTRTGASSLNTVNRNR